MDFAELELPGLLQVVPKRSADARGYFAETFREDAFCARVGNVRFVQENQSLSVEAGTIRGLHFQAPPFAQGKLVRCLAGSLYDVAVDLRTGSPAFGKWTGVTISVEAGNQLWIPAGFAHGFCSLEPNTVISYKVTAYYSAPHDRGVAWDDPQLGIKWPEIAKLATLSEKDGRQPALAALPSFFDFEA